MTLNDNSELNKLRNSVQARFKNNVFTYMGINIFIKALTLITWFVFAALLLPSEIGKFALAMSLIEIIGVVCTFGLDSAISRFYHQKGYYHSNVLSNALAIFFFVSIVLTLGVSLLGSKLAFLSPGFVEIFKSQFNLLLIVLSILSYSSINLISAHFTALGRSYEYAGFQLSQSVIFIIASLIFVSLNYGFTGLLIGRMLAALLPLLFFASREISAISSRHISLRTIRELLKYSTPLMMGSIMGVFTSYLGRFLLDRFTDLSILGVYSFFLMIVTNLHWLLHSFNQAWTPKVYYELSYCDQAKTMKTMESIIFIFSFVYLVGVFAVFLLSKTFVMGWLLKKIYVDNIQLFYILLLGPLFSGISVVTSPLFYHTNRTKRIFIISVLASCLNILITIFMVKYFNQAGAATSYFINVMIGIWFYLLIFKNIVFLPKALFNWIIFVSLFSIISVIGLFLHSNYIFLAFLVISLIIAFKQGELNKRFQIAYDGMVNGLARLSDLRFGK